MQRLSEVEWLERAKRHRARLAPIVLPHLARRSRHEPHPVIDFLFQYYSFPASRLLRWSPGAGVALEGPGARKFLAFEHFEERDGAVTLKPLRLTPERRASAQWILQLLEATASRPPRFHCYGLHEWAMVYRAPHRRHPTIPLRMSDDELVKFVDTQRIICSHFDAFRFFTPAARPLNKLQPARSLVLDLEQSGCLHANMDLYKWATKFWPWITSDLVADAFLLAVEIRELDMRASPYDLRAFGYPPIQIETESGRADYERMQAEFAARAQPIRLRLIDAYRALLESPL
jgi:hypothetical protein